MEVASQVYTRDVERLYEAKKSKTMAALHDVERIELIKKARVRTGHFQIHSVFHTCFPVQPHGRAGGLFRDFLFLPVGGKNEQMESVGIRDRKCG
jgi:hypothetical protein